MSGRLFNSSGTSGFANPLAVGDTAVNVMKFLDKDASRAIHPNVPVGEDIGIEVRKHKFGIPIYTNYR